MTDWARRAVLTGLAASPSMAWAKDKAPAPKLPPRPSLFVGTALEHNSMAQDLLVPPPGLTLPPKASLEGLPGKGTLDAFRGKTILLNLWAEWCPWCLVELQAFDILNQRYANDRFQIVVALTSSEAFNWPSEIKKFLEKVHANTLPPYVDRGDKLSSALAKEDDTGRPALPCTVLIDSKGNLRARAMGAATMDLSKGKVTAWAGQDGVALVEALSKRWLDQLPYAPTSAAGSKT